MPHSRRVMICAVGVVAAVLLYGVSVGSAVPTRPVIATAAAAPTKEDTDAPAAPFEGEWNDMHDVVIGLARFDHAGGWKESLTVYVGTLRRSGYLGRIVLFVHPSLISAPTGAMSALREYLVAHNVELLVGSDLTTCEFPFTIPEHQRHGGELRLKCAEKYPTLPLEWARFALARDWLVDNPNTTWALVTDVRDTYFQRPPFVHMGAPAGRRAYVYEEHYGAQDKTVAAGKLVGIDTSHWFGGLARKCYGDAAVRPYLGKPMLCSGQVAGTRAGVIEMLNVYVGEMLDNAQRGSNCVTPEVPDQPLLNHMVYTKMLAVETVPFGEGAVMTVGGACTTNKGKHGLREFLQFDSENYILDARGRRAPVIHQWDRCRPWAEVWVRKWLAARGEMEAGHFASMDETKGVPLIERGAIPGAPGWEFCSDQYDVCKCRTEVRFGHESNPNGWILHRPEGGEVMCGGPGQGGPFMGDPAPNKIKACHCRI